MQSTKLTVDEIRARFDRDVKSFSKLEVGQEAVMDSLLMLEIISSTAKSLATKPRNILDLGCGAGNYTLKLLSVLPNLDCTLVDLSQPMLDKAKERISKETSGMVTAIQADMRSLDFKPGSFDIIISTMAIHHLREDAEWNIVFRKLHDFLSPGGLLLVADLVSHSNPNVEQLQKERWGEHLETLKGTKFREFALEFSSREDSPRPLLFQIGLLQKAGFKEVDILHKNSCFGVYYAMKC
jgi:tRNA (cmo5U34)-methyltransferase